MSCLVFCFGIVFIVAYFLRYPFVRDDALRIGPEYTRTLILKRLDITLTLVMTEPHPCFPPTKNEVLQAGSLLTTRMSSQDTRRVREDGDAFKFLTHLSHSSNL